MCKKTNLTILPEVSRADSEPNAKVNARGQDAGPRQSCVNGNLLASQAALSETLNITLLRSPHTVHLRLAFIEEQ